MNVPINLNDMINTADHYYSYPGSLTTPTCNEIVTWVVLHTPRTVSKATMDKFWALPVPSKTSEKISKFGSYRPLQPHGKRTVYHTNGPSALCSTHGTSEPDFDCESKVDWWDARNLVIISSILGGVLGLAIIVIVYLVATRPTNTSAQSAPKEQSIYTNGNVSGNAYTATAVNFANTVPPGAAGMA